MTGDFDGDLMFAFWAPDLVQNFHEPDPPQAKPAEWQELIIKTHDTVEEFLQKVPSLPQTVLDQSYIHQLQTHLLSGLNDASVVGKVNTMWEASGYVNGYSHMETQKLAWL